MKKHVVKISAIFAILIFVCNMIVLAFLCINAAEIDEKSAVDGMIITNGLTIISLAVTVWLGISIYNSIEKKEFADIKEEFFKVKPTIETYSQLSNEVKEYTKQQLVNQMYKTGDISCDYIAKCFDKDESGMSTHFLDYKGRILDLRVAEKGAREEKEKAILKGDKEAEKKWEKAEENARREADRLEQLLR